MISRNQLSLLEESFPTEVEDDTDIKYIERMMGRMELARICVGRKQNERAVNNLLLVRKEINKLVKRLKK